jgi:CHASE3 domain sensor protein
MNRKYFFLLSLVCLVAILIDVIFSYKYTSQLTQSIEIRKEELYKLNHYTTFLSHLKDAETGQRGYAITGDPTYLEPYESALNYLRSKEFLDFYLQELGNGDSQITDLMQKLHKLKEPISMLQMAKVSKSWITFAKSFIPLS